MNVFMFKCCYFTVYYVICCKYGMKMVFLTRKGPAQFLYHNINIISRPTYGAAVV